MGACANNDPLTLSRAVHRGLSIGALRRGYRQSIQHSSRRILLPGIRFIQPPFVAYRELLIAYLYLVSLGDHAKELCASAFRHAPLVSAPVLLEPLAFPLSVGRRPKQVNGTNGAIPPRPLVLMKDLSATAQHKGS